MQTEPIRNSLGQPMWGKTVEMLELQLKKQEVGYYDTRIKELEQIIEEQKETIHNQSIAIKSAVTADMTINYELNKMVEKLNLQLDKACEIIAENSICTKECIRAKIEREIN